MSTVDQRPAPSSWAEHAAAAPAGLSWRDLWDTWDGNPKALTEACRRRNAERLAQLDALRVETFDERNDQ